MGQPVNMNGLFDKLHDLKSLFVYGEKLIPIIQSLLDFMKETVPLLENINYSIADSTSKIPKAVHQISNVSSATELATTEILDLVDKVTTEIHSAEANLNSYLQREEGKEIILNDLAFLLSDNSKATKLLEEYRSINTTDDMLASLFESFNSIKHDTNSIAISLQVQDITAQQLAAVNHLICSVQDRLANLVSDLNENDMEEWKTLNNPIQESVVFDSNARYSKSVENQSNVDIIIQTERQHASQDEIDKLFS